MHEIKSYIQIRSSGLSWYYYLHIHGGTGSKDGMGGQYAYYLTYLPPDSERIISTALDHYCKDNGIPCGVGDTIKLAHADFQEKLKSIPLK